MISSELNNNLLDIMVYIINKYLNMTTMHTKVSNNALLFVLLVLIMSMLPSAEGAFVQHFSSAIDVNSRPVDSVYSSDGAYLGALYSVNSTQFLLELRNGYTYSLIKSIWA